MKNANKLFRVRYHAGGDYFYGDVEASSVDDAIDSLRRFGSRHAFSFFFLSFFAAPPVDEFKIVDAQGNELGRWRSGWLQLRLMIAGLLKLERVRISERIYRRHP
jgi:hypothetical protein